MIKVLMTTDTVGGVWTYCLELLRALQPLGIEAALAAKGPVSASQRAAVETLTNVAFFDRDYKLEWMEDPWDDVAQAGEWLTEIAHEFGPDVIHLNDYAHGSLSWSPPLLVVGHSCVYSWSDAVHGVDPGDQWLRYHQVVGDGLRAADVVVAPSRHMLDQLRMYYGAFRAERVILNGCDLKPHRVPKQPFIFAAGRFWDPAKNLAALVQAAPSLQWPVHIAGLQLPGGQPTVAEGVRCLGQLSAAAMQRAYSQASIYALPALYEPFGLTALEAGLAGCALVLGDIPSLREIWGDAAMFVPPTSIDAIVATTNALIDDAALRLDYSRRALMRARQLTAAQMAAQYADCYRQLIHSRHHTVYSAGVA